MKKMICLVLAVMLALLLAVCYAENEHSRDDYSWLDDLSINQLRELDSEIHKRIPGDETESSGTSEDSILIGEWDYVEVRPNEIGHKGHTFIVSITFFPNGKQQWMETCQEDGAKTNNFGGTYERVSDDSVLLSYGWFSSPGTIYEDDDGLHLIYEAQNKIFTKVVDE